MFDSKKIGALDKEHWFYLLVFLNRTAYYKLAQGTSSEALVSRTACDRLFEEIDLDDTGLITCEAFLSWAYGTLGNFAATMRRRLAELDEQKLTFFLREVTGTKHGLIDRSMLYALIIHFFPDSAIEKEASDALFDAIDARKVGQINTGLLLAWIHPQPTKALRMENLSSLLKPSSASEKRRSGFVTAPFETKSHEAVVLELTIGKDYISSIASLEDHILKFVDHRHVQLKIVVDENCRGCRRVVAHIGSGIVLWDRYSMMMHRADPFKRLHTAGEFLVRVLTQGMPSHLAASPASLALMSQKVVPTAPRNPWLPVMM